MTQFDDEAFDHVKWANEVEPRINTYIVKEEAIREGRFYGQKWQLDLRFASLDPFEKFRKHE